MKYLIILAFIPLLVACDARYRYPCQDPSNWDSEDCKKPKCEVNRDCPEHIFKEENRPNNIPLRGMPSRGECK